MTKRYRGIYHILSKLKEEKLFEKGVETGMVNKFAKLTEKEMYCINGGKIVAVDMNAGGGASSSMSGDSTPGGSGWDSPMNPANQAEMAVKLFDNCGSGKRLIDIIRSLFR